MKKFVLVIFVAFFGVSYTMAQSTPFIGYDRVAWGASVADVRNAYNLGDNIPLNIRVDDTNFANLYQENVSESIFSRYFTFIKWQSNEYRLYRVEVIYNDGSDTNYRALYNILEQRYGNRTDIEYGTGNFYTDNISVFGQFNPDIEVRLIKRTIGFGQTENRVLYTWKKTRDDYNASRVQL